MAAADGTGTAEQTIPRAVIAFSALALGAIFMGASPIFVRWADVGPQASAFWRAFLALPFLWGWAWWESGSETSLRSATSHSSGGHSGCVPSPLVGEGQGGGWPNTHAQVSTPLPNPPPQGGREREAVPASRDPIGFASLDRTI